MSDKEWITYIGSVLEDVVNLKKCKKKISSFKSRIWKKKGGGVE